MDQKNFLQSLLPVLFLAAATIGGWLVKPIRFNSERRPTEVSSAAQTRGQQTLDTRLWKDPFEARRAQKASERAKEDKEPRKETDESFRLDYLRASLVSRPPVSPVTPSQMAENPALAAPGDAAVIVAFVAGGKSAEDAEQRRCDRHAVLAGLGMGGYAPEDEAHIGILTVPWARPDWLRPEPYGLDATASSDRPLEGAFEWFVPANPRLPVRHKRVLVLWVPEDEFLSRPLARLAQLAARLGRAGGYEFKFMVLGPRTSGGLVAMCEEAADGRWRHPLPLTGIKVPALDNRTPAWGEWYPPNWSVGLNLPINPALVLNGAEIYSSTATVTDELLPLLNSPPVERRGRVVLAKKLKQDLGVIFRDLATNDAELTAALIEELALRGVRPENKKDAVLLVSEWHTDYGRALPLTFAAQWERLQGRFGFSHLIRGMQVNPSYNLPEGIYKISYLSGVDGEPAPKSKSERDSGQSSQPSVPDSSAGSSNYRPDGDSQLDYAQRMAAHLEAEFTGRGDKRRVAAVGIMGSDVYDKLTLLQALRAKFPQALFFTTDLHAWLQAPEMQPWTRNLIVASGRDLVSRVKTGPKTEGHVRQPPFRDSYQTAIYDAVVSALGGSGRDPKATTWARVFEIGRTESVELDPSHAHANGWRDHAGLRIGLWVALIGFIAVLRRSNIRAWMIAPRGCGKPAAGRAISAVAGGAVLLGAGVAAEWAGYFDEALLGLFFVTMTVGTFLASNRREKLPEADVSDGRWRPWRMAAWTLLAAFFVVGSMVVFTRFESGQFEPREPFRWFEGVSIWPTEIIRLGAVLLGVYWIAQTRYKLRDCAERLTEKYRLEGPTQPEEVSVARSQERVVARDAWRTFTLHVDAAKNSSDLPRKGKISRTQTLLARYGTSEHLRWVLGVSGVLMLFWLYFNFWQSDALRVPFRGSLSERIDTVTITMVLGVYTLLSVQVFDVIRHTRMLIRELALQRTAWPRAYLDGQHAELNILGSDLDGWVDIKFIAELTETVGHLVLLPFGLLFILLAAVNPYFDHWVWNQPSLVVLFIINAAVPLICGFFLCQMAEQARTAAAAQLTVAMIRTSGLPESTRLGVLLKEVNECRDGAFRAIYEQPYILALLIPLGGTGSIQLLQQFMGG